MTLKEDTCQTRTGAALSLLARLNSTVLALMDRLGVSNVARQTRYFDAHVEQTLQLLLPYWMLFGVLEWESLDRHTASLANQASFGYSLSST